ncbi:MAG: YIP1 family protein [Paracoccaceae bacterium]
MQVLSDHVSSPTRSPAWEAEVPPDMNDRILEAWRDMSASTRRLLAERPSEGRLLFFVILSDAIFFLSWTLKTLLAPTSAVAETMPFDVAALLLAAILFRTASLYVLAALAAAAATLCGGVGSWRDTRAAVFWGALVSAPFGLLAAGLAVVLNRAEASLPALADPLFALPPYYVGLVPFLWFVAAGIAAAHRFERIGWSFLTLSVAAVALSLAGVYLSG